MYGIELLACVLARAMRLWLSFVKLCIAAYGSVIRGCTCEMWHSVFCVVFFGFLHGDSSIADSFLLDFDILGVSVALRVCIELSDALQLRALGFAQFDVRFFENMLRRCDIETKLGC